MSNMKTKDILEKTEFINMTSKANMYNQIFVGEGFIITLIILKILGIFGINNNFWIILKSMA